MVTVCSELVVLGEEFISKRKTCLALNIVISFFMFLYTFPRDFFNNKETLKFLSMVVTNTLFKVQCEYMECFLILIDIYPLCFLEPK